MLPIICHSRQDMERYYDQIREFAQEECGISQPLTVRFPDWEAALKNQAPLGQDEGLVLKIDVRCQMGLNTLGIKFMVNGYEAGRDNGISTIRRYLLVLSEAIRRKQVEQELYDAAVKRRMPCEEMEPKES